MINTQENRDRGLQLEMTRIHFAENAVSLASQSYLNWQRSKTCDFLRSDQVFWTSQNNNLRPKSKAIILLSKK